MHPRNIVVGGSDQIGTVLFFQGLNFQLSAVLVSLAFFTYVEHELRRKLATHLDACIEARACRACNHRNMARNPYVLLTNLAFGILAAFNLAYLGDMFDSSSKAEEVLYHVYVILFADVIGGCTE